MPRPALAACCALLAPSLALAAPAAAATPDTLNIGLQLEPPSLDPTTGPAEAIRDIVYDNVFESLTRLDEHGSVQPQLAKRWSIADGGRRYEFALDTGAGFSDGTPFDCAIVKFSLDRARAPDSLNPERAFYAPIASISCPAPDHAVITLSAPDSEFLYHLAWAASAMVAPATAATNAQHPVGTGPYVLDNWKRGSSITLSRREHLRAPIPAIARVSFHFIADPLTAADALDGNRLDGYVNFPNTDMLSRFQGDPRFTVLVGRSPIKLIWALNEARAPFNDLRVRLALAAAIDRYAIVTGYANNFATVIGSHDTPEDPDYLDLSAHAPYDVGHAQDLLRQAGVAAGTVIEIALPPTDYAHKVGDMLAAYLAQVGLVAKLVPMQWPQWLGDVYGHANYQTTVIAHTEPRDLDIYARPHYYFGYHDTVYDALFVQYRTTTDPAAQHALWQKLQQRLADTQANVFIAALPRISIWNARLRGMWRDEPIPLNRIADLSWTP